MTGVASRPRRQLPRRPAPRLPAPETRAERTRRDSAGVAAERAPAAGAVELLLFFALGALACAQWSRLVADPPLAGLAGALAIVTAGAAVLSAIARRRPPYARLLALAVTLAATAAATVAIGLPARLLAPDNWPELIDNLSRGLAGIEDTEMPYRGGDVWVRITLLAIAPVLLGIAAALAFWPAGARRLRRVLALAALVTLYGIAVTLDSPGGELLWGVLLLVLCVAWLWLPGFAARRAAMALAAAAAAGALALPVAAALETAKPWWNYESWDWFGRDSEVRFDWNHSYGPLEWPQKGTTLLSIRSTEPLYWKASVLDRFDGFTWQRATSGDPLGQAERAARRIAPGAELPDRHREWVSQASFEFEALASGLVIGAGTPQAVQGLDGVSVSEDGTLRSPGEQLRSGDQYSVVTYAPRPSADELRRAPSRYPQGRFRRQALVGLPATVAPVFETGPTSSTAGPGAEAGEELEGGFAPARANAMPLWGQPEDPELRATMLASPYADVYQLAHRLTAGAETPFEAVRAIERHLRRGYDYTRNVPLSTYPLHAFLFGEQAGYCQQFSGAMALMLRMVGIPSRVVSGFAPGSFDQERGAYEVRDTDAHSWVEVYFRGIGWVTFDPTPAAAPAASQTVNAELGTFFRGRGSVAEQGRGRARSLERALEGGKLGGAGDDDGGALRPITLGVAAIMVIAGALATVVFLRRRRALLAGHATHAQLAEFRRALVRLGWDPGREPTLLALERRFGRAGRPTAAAYAAALRAHRYAPEAPPAPGPRARSALRRSLSTGGGLRRRLRGLFAIPPGGPAQR